METLWLQPHCCSDQSEEPPGLGALTITHQDTFNRRCTSSTNTPRLRPHPSQNKEIIVKKKENSNAADLSLQLQEGRTSAISGCHVICHILLINTPEIQSQQDNRTDRQTDILIT